MRPIRLWSAIALLVTIGAGPLNLALGQEAANSPTTAGEADRYPEESKTPEELEAEREKIWNSPEMRAAREWLVDHMARSAQITPSQSKRYMEELERLNAQQLKLWLMTFEEQQAERARQQQTFERAREQAVGNALRQNDARRQQAENINRNRDEAARQAQETLASQQQQAHERSRQLVSDRDAAARAALEPTNYIWLNTLPWGPYAGYPVNGGPAIDPAAYRGVLGVTDREPRGTVAPGSAQGARSTSDR
jgi:hypothetical protein